MMGQPIIQFEHISKAFAGQPVLRDLSLSIEAGEFVTVIGRTGCGKTTFLNSLTKLYQPTKGEILINGEVVDLKKHNIAYIFQEYLQVVIQERCPVDSVSVSELPEHWQRDRRSF